MTIGDKLSQGAAQLQETWTSLTDTWIQTTQDLVGSATADPFGLLSPDVVIDQLLDFTRRALEINWDLISSLTGATVTTEYSVVRGATAATEAVATEIVTPHDVAAPAVEKVAGLEPPEAESVRSEQKPTPAIAAGTYSRVSKADLQKALSGRHLPKSGTVKELRERLIEADRKAATT